MRPLVLAALLALPAQAQTLDMADADPVARALLEAALADGLRESRASGAPEHFSAARVDLNDDGRPEIVAQLYSGFLCGAAVGCPTAIFRAEPDGGHTHVATVWADYIRVLPENTGGWRDLSLGFQMGTVRATWTGDDYARP